MPYPTNDLERQQLMEDFEACSLNFAPLPPNKRPELFLLPAETLNSISVEEVIATWKDMEELDLAHQPYPTVDVGVPADFFVRNTRPDGTIDEDDPLFHGWQLRFRYVEGSTTAGTPILIAPSGKIFDFMKLSKIHSMHMEADFEANIIRLAGRLRATLIVLLATKNATKSRTKNAALGMGIGAKKPKNAFRPLYTTTITVPHTSELEDYSDAIPGSPKRPHLRRGHRRNQRFGPRREFIKVIWIEPAFVNCDETFISSRTAYNTSLGLTA